MGRTRVARLLAITGMLAAVALVTTARGATTTTTGVAIAAAGDIACDPASTTFNGGLGRATSCQQMAVSNLLLSKSYGAVLPLGDTQYYCGSRTAYQQSYAPSWGRLKSITHPAIGNHEYLTTGSSTSTGCNSTNAQAAGYFGYFGAAANPLGSAAKGWYSYDVGSWHLIALNSSCTPAGGCSATSPQGKWLTSDLAAHRNACTLAYWHVPLFSSGGRASTAMKSLFTLLYNAGADVVLSGHDHLYERFAPQTPTGALDTSRGIREFVVGTGGANHTGVASLAANSQVHNASTFGVLQLTLNSTSYDWKFLPAAGGTFTDSGSASCH